MKLYKSFIWSNIPIALDAAAWTALTYKTLVIKPDALMLFIAFGFTWLFYTKDRTKSSPADSLNNPERTQWYVSQTYLNYLMGLVLSLLIVCLCFKLILIVPAFIGIIPCLFYTKQWTIKGYTFSIKSLAGMKVVLVAFLWVVLTVFFPLASLKMAVPKDRLLHLSLMVGLFVMVQINTNDLRDIKGDAIDNVKSFAVLLGDQKARLLGIAFIVLGTYFGWSLFAHSTLIAYSIFLMLRTYFYQKEADIYWQTPISLQGVLAYCLLVTPQ